MIVAASCSNSCWLHHCLAIEFQCHLSHIHYATFSSLCGIFCSCRWDRSQHRSNRQDWSWHPWQPSWSNPLDPLQVFLASSCTSQEVQLATRALEFWLDAPAQQFVHDIPCEHPLIQPCCWWLLTMCLMQESTTLWVHPVDPWSLDLSIDQSCLFLQAPSQIASSEAWIIILFLKIYLSSLRCILVLSQVNNDGKSSNRLIWSGSNVMSKNKLKVKYSPSSKSW